VVDYRVNLEIFAGPLDLLLYLVRKEEVDIYDISIAKITDQYLHYIEMLKSLDVDLAGDFLVMAATLLQIKSAMLLPQSETGQGGADELADPRAELIRQLLEYKQFKDAANLLSIAAEEQTERFPRPETIIKELKPSGEPELDLGYYMQIHRRRFRYEPHKRRHADRLVPDRNSAPAADRRPEELCSNLRGQGKSYRDDWAVSGDSRTDSGQISVG